MVCKSHNHTTSRGPPGQRIPDSVFQSLVYPATGHCPSKGSRIGQTFIKAGVASRRGIFRLYWEPDVRSRSMSTVAWWVDRFVLGALKCINCTNMQSFRFIGTCLYIFSLSLSDAYKNMFGVNFLSFLSLTKLGTTNPRVYASVRNRPREATLRGQGGCRCHEHTDYLPIKYKIKKSRWVELVE